jgi:hypothetical protein
MQLARNETPLEVTYSAQGGGNNGCCGVMQRDCQTELDSIKTGGAEGTTWAPAGRFSRKKVPTTFQNFYVEKKTGDMYSQYC